MASGGLQDSGGNTHESLARSWAQNHVRGMTHWHRWSVEVVCESVQSNPATGLSSAEAAERLQQHGPNELVERAGKGPVRILWEQFSSVLVLILIAAAVISGFLGKPTEAIAISAIVVLFAVLGFIQEYRAERAMAALKQLAVPSVRVRRDGAIAQVSARELVPGDVVLLESGNVVPADMRVIESMNLRVQEAALTGESEPVDKIAAVVDLEDPPLGDRFNMAFMGTVVGAGRGAGVVVATGMGTELGRIAELIQGVHAEQTPLQRQLDRVGKTLAVLGVIVALLIMALGLLQGAELSQMFLVAVSVAVAVVPEGLPAVVTVTLALGAQRMLRRRALIRKLPAVETLGSVTTICSDKTGTLTVNRMTVTVIDVVGHSMELAGTSRRWSEQSGPTISLHEQPPAVELALMVGAMCNDASLQPEPQSGAMVALGDPTEGALLVAAQQAGVQRTTLEQLLPRVGEVGFDSERKRMTTVHRLPQEPAQSAALQLLQKLKARHVAFVKGAVDGIVELASHVWDQDQMVPMSEEWRERLREANAKLASSGMRVLGLAFRPLTEPQADASVEQDLVILGLVGMIDPPRPEVREAVRVCKLAGIRPVMITGDHPLTARFIAHDLGIATDGAVLTGQQLDRLSNEDFARVVREVSVYARVSPEHKLRIVEHLQRQGQVVAMTGDGVNDSPALKRADIGVAMGITGTDVSKEASAMVLLDDNFATIVAAVEEGRVIYDNIRRFVRFSVAGNLGKVLVMLLAPLMGITTALLPLQLLWLNLLTDGLLGVGLGLEPAEPGTMRRPPRMPQAGIFTRALNLNITWVGALIGAVALAAGFAYYDGEPAGGDWQTMMFTVLAFAQVGQALATRAAEGPLRALKMRTNPTMTAMVLLVIALQLAVIYLPLVQEFFNVTPLSPEQLAVAVGLGVVPFVAIQLERWVRKRSLGEGEAAAVV